MPVLIGQTFGSAVEHHWHDEVLDAAKAARQQPYTASVGMIIDSADCMNERERDALASFKSCSAACCKIAAAQRGCEFLTSLAVVINVMGICA